MIVDRTIFRVMEHFTIRTVLLLFAFCAAACGENGEGDEKTVVDSGNIHPNSNRDSSIDSQGASGTNESVVSGTSGGGSIAGRSGTSGSEGGTDGRQEVSGQGGSSGSGVESERDGSAGSGTPDSGISASADCTLYWSSGFESGFPGEFLDYDNGSYSPSGTMPSGRVSAWTIIDSSSGEPIFEGERAYKGWIVDAASDSHRAYPVIHTDIPTPLVNTFMVYLDADYGQMSQSEWIHFGTWGNEDDRGSGTWALHTMSVRDSKLEFAHTDPFSGEFIGPQTRPNFPIGQWIRFTVYIIYEDTEGLVQVWQDGVPMLRANVSALAEHPGTRLTRAHWGMYASKETTQGVQYNDAIRIWTLSEPLTDLDVEPDCYIE